jgi:hypothetical protein
VTVHQTGALKRVANDGEAGWPDGVVVPEEGEGEEDVGVGVEGAFFKEGAAC